MTARRVLLVCLLVTLLTSANGLCNIVDLSLLRFICGLVPVCSITSLLNYCQGDSLISIKLSSGSISLAVNSDLIGLSVHTQGGAQLDLRVLGVVAISTDLNISGNAKVLVQAGSLVTISGNVLIAPSSILEVEGDINVGGNTVIKGNLNFLGSLSNSNAKLTSSHPVIISGAPGAPATITGNGKVDADVVVEGETTAGKQNTHSALYFNKELEVKKESTFNLNGNVTVEGYANISGVLHLEGARKVGRYQDVWFKPVSSVHLEGTPANQAFLTGNGGVVGNVIMGDSSVLSPGNSPGNFYFDGDLALSSGSLLRIEVAGSGETQYDQYFTTGEFWRDGTLVMTFLNNYRPSTNDRLVFGTHSAATGTFHTVYGLASSAYYSPLVTGFAFNATVSHSYLQCSIISA